MNRGGGDFCSYLNVLKRRKQKRINRALSVIELVLNLLNRLI